jgi:hypothetical protein
MLSLSRLEFSTEKWMKRAFQEAHSEVPVRRILAPERGIFKECKNPQRCSENADLTWLL